MKHKQHYFSKNKLQTDRIKIVPKPDYSPDSIYISEIEIMETKKNIALFSAGTKAYVLDQVKGAPIIPAQGSGVMELKTKKGMVYIWMGDLWGSASDNEKGHDYQYWQLLRFDEKGNIFPLEWTDDFTITL